MANVLVIEDTADIRKPVVRALEAAGHTVDEATTPDEAKERLHEKPHDFVVCDFDLKAAETGVDLAQYIKDHSNVPTIGHPGFFLFSSTDRQDIEDRAPALRELSGKWIKGVYKKDQLTKIMQDINRSAKGNPDQSGQTQHRPAPGNKGWGERSGR